HEDITQFERGTMPSECAADIIAGAVCHYDMGIYHHDVGLGIGTGMTAIGPLDSDDLIFWCLGGSVSSDEAGRPGKIRIPISQGKISSVAAERVESNRGYICISLD